VRVPDRRGLLIADSEHTYLDLDSGSSLDHLQAASINYRIAIGPQAGRKALIFYCARPWFPRDGSTWGMLSSTV
jgi:hypothetical protein